MPGVPVTLSDKNGNPIMDVATGSAVVTTTAADGSYWFTGLAPGEYGVRFALPPDYVFSSPPGQGDMQQLSGAPGAPLPDAASDIVLGPDGTGMSPTEELVSGDNSTSFDAGIYIPVVVSGSVWDDANANGIKDAGEEALEGATITVFNSLVDMMNDVPSVAVSDANGEYTLELPPGAYYGFVTAPSSEYELSPLRADEENGNDFDPSIKQSQPIELGSGDSGAGHFDAGFYVPVTIDSYVWWV